MRRAAWMLALLGAAGVALADGGRGHATAAQHLRDDARWSTRGDLHRVDRRRDGHYRDGRRHWNERHYRGDRHRDYRPPRAGYRRHLGRGHHRGWYAPRPHYRHYAPRDRYYWDRYRYRHYPDRWRYRHPHYHRRASLDLILSVPLD